MKLRDLRHMHLITQRELAQDAGISESTINSIEHGYKRRWRISVARRIARALDVRPQDIDEFQHLVGTPEMLAQVEGLHYQEGRHG